MVTVAEETLDGVLREFAESAYWYGEDTGDYAMDSAWTQDWFQEAKARIAAAARERGES